MDGYAGNNNSSLYSFNSCLTLSLPCLPRLHLKKKTPTKSAKFETIKAFLPPSHKHVKGFLSKCTVLKVRFVVGSSNMLFAGVYVCTFQPGNFTGWESEGVKGISLLKLCLSYKATCSSQNSKEFAFKCHVDLILNAENLLLVTIRKIRCTKLYNVKRQSSPVTYLDLFYGLDRSKHVSHALGPLRQNSFWMWYQINRSV